MIFTKLELHNFGVYAGYNKFEFNSEKPVVLIGGMNGRGKTTFLEGVLLALYGAKSFAYNESKYKSYGQYLKSFVNIADGSLETFVNLEFKLESGNEIYSIKRTWNGKGVRTKEQIVVLRAGRLDDFLTQNWSMFIEKILPSGLASFFFFDGEKIAKLAVENTNTQIKESIKTLLGITIIDSLESDINKIIKKNEAKVHDKEKIEKLQKLRENKEKAESDFKQQKEEINKLEEELLEVEKKLEQAKSDYSAKGGKILLQRDSLMNNREELVQSTTKSKDLLIEAASNELPLVLVKSLLKKVQIQANLEYESKIMGYTVSKIKSLFDAYNSNDESIQNFINYVEQESEREHIKTILDLSDQGLFQLRAFLNFGCNNIKNSTLANMKMVHEMNDRISEIDNYLSVEIDEKALSKIYNSIGKLTDEKSKLELKIELAIEKEKQLNGEYIRANSEFNSFVEQLLLNLEKDDDSNRIIQYGYQATKILEEYKLRLQKQKIGILAETMTNCYRKLANKKNLISRIEIDTITLDFVYMNNNNEAVAKESLSAGEKQLMVIALLWALAICSKKKLPVIIDTPLSRMDSIHRVALIQTYFPMASEQTIILSTDSEIDKHYYELMKKDVGDEFTLIYDDELKRSIIKKGYFVGE